MSGARRVLVVDDSPVIRELATLALGTVGGMEVTEAASGPEALDRLDGGVPDAVLLDVDMPGMDGPEVLERLRGDERTTGVPVVFVTGKDGPDEHDRLTALGAAGVIAKPFQVGTLAHQVSALAGWAS